MYQTQCSDPPTCSILLNSRKKSRIGGFWGNGIFRFWLRFLEGFLESPYQMGRSINNPSVQVLQDRQNQYVSSRSKFILIQSYLLPLVVAFLAVPAHSLKGPFFLSLPFSLKFQWGGLRLSIFLTIVSWTELTTSTWCALVFECVVQHHESTYVCTGPALTSPIQTAIAIVHPLIVDKRRGLQRLLFLWFVCV